MTSTSSIKLAVGLGTLKLLASARLPRLVGLGTAITIVAIGIDPFMQQVIHFDFQPNLYGDQYGNPNGVNTISCVWTSAILRWRTISLGLQDVKLYGAILDP